MLPHSFVNWMGAEIHVGDVVGYCTGGSYPYYRMGQVMAWSEKDGEVSAKVNWLWQHSWLGGGTPEKPNVDGPTTVKANRLFQLPEHADEILADFRQRLDSTD